MGRLLRMEEVAMLLGVSYHQARKIVMIDGEVPHVTVGQTGIRVDEDALQAYVVKLQKEQEDAGTAADKTE